MTRQALPNRREIETFTFTHGGIKSFASFSLYDDGRLAETFLDSGKPGSAIQAFAHDGATAISLALQHGCPAETLRHAMTRDDRSLAASPLGALLDLVVEAKS